MGLDILTLNQSLLENLPTELLEPILKLITILQVAGIIFIGYLVFLIIRWVLNFKRYRKVKKISKKVELIDRKLDVLLGKKRLKELEKEFEPKKEKNKEKKKKKR